MTSTIVWEALQRRLEAEKDAVAAEIQAYPRPIAGCDAQFNHLLERRRLLWEELSYIETARGDRTASRRGLSAKVDLPRCRGQACHPRSGSSLSTAVQPD